MSRAIFFRCTCVFKMSDGLSARGLIASFDRSHNPTIAKRIQSVDWSFPPLTSMVPVEVLKRSEAL